MTKSSDLSITKLLDLVVVCFLIGLVTSKALLSIATAMLSILALYYYLAKKHLRNSRIVFPDHLGPYLATTLIFIVTVISGINSEDASTWSNFLSKKLPFLTLPLTFMVLYKPFIRNYFRYLAFYVLVIFITSLVVGAGYLSDFENINSSIGRGQAIPTPIDHTEYSLFTAFAVMVCIYLWDCKIQYGRWFLGIGVFLIAFLHVLAVRSGLAVLYGAGMVTGLYYWIGKGKWGKLLLYIFTMVVVGILLFSTVPSLKTKLAYMRYDIQQFQNGEGINYSDSERLYSIMAGWQIFKQEPLLGTGIGDLKTTSIDYYQDTLGTTLYHYPHNQLVFTLASMGLLGLIFYSIGVFYPIWVNRRSHNLLYVSFVVVIILSGIVENTLERTFSIGFYLFFALLLITFLDDQRWKTTS